ncbi:MAG: L,D-transpeptidase family protein [Firmicutes bacterium]|nr:L,D-transpeptidase family protein [Bacillota bacterium]
MKNTKMKRILAWALCLSMVITASCFSFAEPAESMDPASDDAIVTAEDLEETPAVTGDEEEEPAAAPADETTASENPEGVPADPEEEAGEPAEVTAAAEPEPAGFDQYPDVKDHWAKAYLEKAFNDGLLKGFDDGTMQPDTKITGAQMITILTRILPTAQSQAVSLGDDVWYKDAASKALALGIITNNDVAGLNDKMLRRHAIVMMADAFQLADADPDLTKASQYEDFKTLDNVDKRIFATLVNDNYIQGWENILMLDYDITRAEFVTILYRVIEDYLNTSEITDFGTVTNDALISGGAVTQANTETHANVWTGTDIDTVDLNTVRVPRLVIRGDNLAKLQLKGSLIDKLVISARSGNVDLDCVAIGNTVVGDGSGTVTLKPAGNKVGITGDGRVVTLENEAGNVAILGSNNTVVLNSGANADAVKIYGQNNTVVINSNVKNLIVEGKNNTVSGEGNVTKTTRYTKSGSITVAQGSVEEIIDEGIKSMTASVSLPTKVNPGAYMVAKLNLTNAPAGKLVNVVWYVNGSKSVTEQVSLPPSKDIALNYYVPYELSAPDTYSISAEVQYTTAEGEAQVVKAPAAKTTVDKSGLYGQVINKVTTTYKGNRTTQWAIDHDLTKQEKEIFVNYKGYSSSSKYLIWVNIGTQHTMVFEGSKGNWKMIRSGLVSTGIKDNTPRGVWQTTYKQSAWAFNTYTVKPVVRFYGGGFAMHSRLYKPGTTTLLSGASNGVGYPLSHGCVRMQKEDIEWIYNNVPNGTTVVVY